MDTENDEDAMNLWKDDLLDRKDYALFLSAYIASKYGRNESSFVVALDAPWGLGKSFFIERWSKQLLLNKTPTVVFNAWEDDSSEDPVVSFLAELRRGIYLVCEEFRCDTGARALIQNSSAKIVRSFRRATLSAGKVVALSVVKKVTGVAIDDLISSFSEGDGDRLSLPSGVSISSTDFGDLSRQSLESGLDEFFDKALEEHVERKSAINDLKKSLGDLVQALGDGGGSDQPLYIFIDELDRCRPDYAIRLLEGIKHLFNVKGVVFVIATNLSQLSKSICAVYGVDFDGHNYLKRFFDVEFELPQPTRIRYLQFLLQAAFPPEMDKYSGLDKRLGNPDTSALHAFAAVSEAMSLDLRAMKRVLTIVEAVVANLPTRSPVLGLWLFFVAALKHNHPDEFQKIFGSVITVEEFTSICRAKFGGGFIVKGISFDMQRNVGSRRVQDFELSEVLSVIYAVSIQSVDHLMSVMRKSDFSDSAYPQYLNLVLYDGWGLNQGMRHPISKYPRLVAMAGHLS